MGKLRVLMFGWEYAPIVSGGLGVVCRSLSQSLNGHGIDITFVLPKIVSRIKVDDIDIINASKTEVDDSMLKFVEVSSVLSPYMNERDFRSTSEEVRRKQLEESDKEIYGGNLFEEVARYALRAMSLARENVHDVIHAHDWMTFQAAANAKKVSGKPLIVHIHATELERTANNPDPAICKYEKEGLEMSDKIIAVSEKTKAKITSHYGIHPEKIEVVHNAVDKPARPSSKPKRRVGKKKTVLFLARLAASKGADYLLRAAAKVLAIDENVRFVFVGKGGMSDYLEDLAEELNISDKVEFPGFLRHDRVDKAYREADLFVMPSIAEPFGITALEAMRNGTPVLMSKQSGASEVVKNVLKVDFWDIDEMANKILAVLNHSPLSSSLSLNGYEDLERMDWDVQSRKVVAIYNALLNQFAV